MEEEYRISWYLHWALQRRSMIKENYERISGPWRVIFKATVAACWPRSLVALSGSWGKWQRSSTTQTTWAGSPWAGCGYIAACRNLSDPFPFSQFYIPPLMVNIVIPKRVIFHIPISQLFYLFHCWDIYLIASSPYSLQPWEGSMFLWKNIIHQWDYTVSQGRGPQSEL